MPIEIRELVIKAIVDQSQGSGTANSGAPGKGYQSNSSPGEDMIKECVEKILAVLKEKNER
jgi:hypothetical protein